MKSLLLLLAAATIAPLPSSATAVGETVQLTPTLSAKVLTVNGDNHTVSVFANPDNKPTGELNIGNTYFIGLNNYRVVNIAAQGFVSCDLLTGVTVGADLNLIGTKAFYGCTKMAYFKENRPGSVEVLGDNSFGHTYALKTISLPGVEFIGEYAFRMSGLTSASFPAVKTISGAAFYECKNLEDFTGGELLSTVGNIAFSQCHPLKGVTLGRNLSTIGSMAFTFNEKMTQIVIPAGLKKMAENPFQGSAINRVFVLTPNFMDFCDESRALCNSNIRTVYCIPSLLTPIKNYFATGSAKNPASSLPKAVVLPITDVLDLQHKDGNRYAAVKKLDGITDLHVYDGVTGSEITPSGGFYTITGDNVRLSYRIDGINLLDYDMAINNAGAVEGIEIDEDNSEAVYYNLQGIRIDNPGNGLYIRRTAKGSEVVRL